MPGGELRARGAVRDVGRVLGVAYGDMDRIAKLMPDTLGISLEKAIQQSPDLRARMGPTVRSGTSSRRRNGSRGSPAMPRPTPPAS